jgi:hypothetical protein
MKHLPPCKKQNNKTKKLKKERNKQASLTSIDFLVNLDAANSI